MDDEGNGLGHHRLNQADDETRKAADLDEWYSSITTRRVDLIGNFGSSERFFIHGDSLLRHCFSQGEVDMTYNSFQLLHLVYEVEKFLLELQQRGCSFDIVFFTTGELRGALFPWFEEGTDMDKGALAAGILREHLRRSHDYVTSGLRSLVYAMVTQGYPVALMNDVIFHSSKVFADVIASPQGEAGTSSHLTVAFKADHQGPHARDRSKELQSMRQVMSLPAVKENMRGPAENRITAREALALCLVRDRYRDALESRRQNRTRRPGLPWHFEATSLEELLPPPQSVATIMLHFGALRELSLAERSGLKRDDNLQSFCNLSPLMLRSYWDLVNDDEDVRRLNWDLYDGTDGRLLEWMGLHRSSWHQLPSRVHARACLLIDLAMDGLDEEWRNSVFYTLSDCSHIDHWNNTESDPPAVSVLPFSHPALDEHLKSVCIETSATVVTSAASSKVFKELADWQNNKRQIDPTKISSEKGVFVSKRHREHITDIDSYAASLTNAGGQIGREITKELQAVKATTSKSLDKENQDALRHWEATLNSLEVEESLVKRYNKALEYLDGCSSDALAVIEPEVRLYLCNTLWLMWKMHSDNSQQSEGLDVVAILWDQVLLLSRLDGPAQIKEAARNLAALIGLPLNHPIPQSSSLRLLFDPMDAKSFQLEHCGPYMKSDFDSQPDSRLAPFQPDAWRRSALDAIDANQSLVFVAPTSAGKTSISFYAMKKVLDSHDDDVLVYVAPTEAAANQIAAEISARYKKSYRSESKSVWAIHTREYQVNNSTTCQILVTVPRMLQVMLLSPSNSNRPKAWSRRVKRIVFDEIHSIDNAKDGIIWEQLLILAPCPIIALSATVGNAKEFCEWLAASQRQKGHELRMIVHEARYSEQRKFLYFPSSGTETKALKKHDRLHIPGLDKGTQPNEDFVFIHPIATLFNGRVSDHDNLKHVALEPRDCHSLWRAMARLQNKKFPLAKVLDPHSYFPTAPGKADIQSWEAALKKVLKRWMLAIDSPFNELRKELLGPRLSLMIPSSFNDGSVENLSDTIIPLLYSLHNQDSLPALVFNFGIANCEKAAKSIIQHLEKEEIEYKENSKYWAQKLQQYGQWLREASMTTRLKYNERIGVRIDRARGSPWKLFDPRAPLEQYSFADKTKMSNSELEELLRGLNGDRIPPWLLEALKRGIGVHHAGLSRRYRLIVEILFCKKYLRVVIATETLALGINMPCKTVVFSGDSVLLTPLIYLQGSGQAGRRGFALLGNVVFANISVSRIFEVMSSRPPDLRVHFPSSATLVLRLLSLLHNTNESQFAVDALNSLLSHTQPYIGGSERHISIHHHVRSSIEYLRKQHLLLENGEPLNFAGLVSNLYFAENAAFAFHALLRFGYFHRLCTQIDERPRHILHVLMLVMSHFFGRKVIHSASANFKEAPQGSPSVVFLPPLPDLADEMLLDYNERQVKIFKGYLRSYVSQHLEEIPNDMLPVSKRPFEEHNIRGERFTEASVVPSAISPFIALSGYADRSIDSISELCYSVRAGVFLEESAIPYTPVDTDEELNAYLYDFFNNGDLTALTRDNCIEAGEVRVLLKDFTLVLATIVRCLENYMRVDAQEDDMTMSHEVDEGYERVQLDEMKKQKGVSKIAKEDSISAIRGAKAEEVEEQRHLQDTGPILPESQNTTTDGEWSLVNVLKAFTLLKEKFEENFRKTTT